MPPSLTRAALATVLGIAALVSCGADSTAPPACPTTSPVPHTTVVCIGAVQVHAEIAATLAEREQGLMGRTSLSDSAGMLFAFGHDQILSFWMKNTQINLAIAFLDSDRTILNIEEMTALDETTFHRSAGLARYALEVKQGWFAARGIKAGVKVTFTLPTGLSIDP